MKTTKSLNEENIYDTHRNGPSLAAFKKRVLPSISFFTYAKIYAAKTIRLEFWNSHIVVHELFVRSRTPELERDSCVK